MAVPEAPAVTVVQVSDHLEVQWQPNAADVTQTDDGEEYISNVESWEVERSADGSTGWAQVRDEPDETVQSYADTDADTADTEYFYRVRGVNTDGDGDYSEVASGNTLAAPTAPTAITAANEYENVRVTWTLGAATGSSVELERSINGTDYTALATLTGGSVSYLDEAVDADTAYWYRVRDVNAVGDSAYATVSGSLTTVASVPSEVSDVSTTSVPTGIRVDWTAVESTNIDSYEILRSDDYGQTYQSLEDGVSDAVETYTDTTTVPGQQYWYRVVVEWSGGDSKPSDPAFGIGGGGAESNDGYRPNRPRNLTATADSANQITCRWADCSVVERGYEINYRAQGAVSWEPLSLAMDTQERAVTSLLPNTTYEFRVRALGNGPASDWTPTVTATTQSSGGGTLPTAPSNLVLTSPSSRDFQLRATWTDNSNNETGFEIEWRNWRDLGQFLSATMPANATGYTINQDPIGGVTPLQEGGIYFARVRARNAVGNSAWSNTATGTVYSPPTVSNPPTNFRAVNVTQNTVTLTWTDTNNGNTSYFLIQRSFDSGASWQRIPQIGPSARSYTDAQLNPRTAVWYRILAGVNNARGETVESDWSNIVQVVTSISRPTNPDPPYGVTATHVGSGVAVRVNWDYTFLENEVAGFTVYRSTTSGSGYASVSDVGPYERTFLDTGLTGGTTYYYIVRAFNALGEESVDSNEEEVTTTAPVGVPDAASNLVALLSGGTTALLSWSDNSGDESGFKVQRGTAEGGPYSTIATTEANATSYMDVGLDISTTYYYVIVATNGAGDGTASNEATITTSGDADPAPTAVNATARVTGPNSVTLTWSSTSGVQESYVIYRGETAESIASIATPGPATQTYPDTGLTANSVYYYRVDAVNGAGTAEGELLQVATPRATSSGQGPPDVLYSLRREFKSDDDPVTLISGLPHDAIIHSLFVQTDDMENGPGITISLGGQIIARLGPNS
jgi:titin